MENKYVTNITNNTVTAMLKLTSSFYRYLYVSCVSLQYKTHVRVSSQFGEGRERCGLDHKKHTNRKRSRVKTTQLNAQQFVQNNQMSEPLQPTGKHVSYGGRFTVSGEQSSSTETNIPKEGCSGQDREIPSNFRVWENISKRSSPNNGSFKFKVVSYNVLAQYLLECHPYLYTVCSPKDLTWNVRASRLYNEIVALAPDILCLQEVQVSHLNTFYSKFEDIGYSGIFKQKTGHRQDGCAIYFKRSMFELQDQITVEFYQPELPILNRDNIGLIVKLLPRGYTTPIVVATTHLLYNPKRTDVRLAQMQVFLAEIDRFAFHSREKEPNHVPIILTGDFNSTPDSAVIKLLDRGYVMSGPFRDDSDWERIGVTDNCQHLSVYLNRQEGKKTDFKNVKIHNSDYRPSRPTSDSSPLSHELSVLFNSGHIGHSLRLMSAYNKYKPDGSYEASTFQDYWVTVDYIYFSCCTNLFLRDRLRLPTALECEVLGHLPNNVYASDHLALAAVFELTTPHVKL